MKTKIACALAAALGSTTAFAETKALDPHVHGIASLQIVQEGAELAITLDSPAASLLGFEHQPESDDQHTAVEQLTVQLESFSGALLINASAGCKVTDSEIAVLADMDHDDHGHDDEHHDEDKHDDEDNHDEHEGEGAVHSEVNASWMLTCDSPSELATLDVLLFDGNSFLETVSAEVLLESGPMVQELTPDSTVLNFK